MSSTVPASAAAAPSDDAALAQQLKEQAAHHAALQQASGVAVPAAHSTRFLSIQSSVVYGYVGNKASNFPIQLLGFDVDPMHSCQFSNHTGHASFSGVKTSAADCRSITSGLRQNKFLQRYTHLLTGYMSSVEFMEESVELIREMKKITPQLVFACDPVMGDNDKMYVPAPFVSLYRDSLLPLCDIATPNQTEAELLSGIKIVDIASAYANLVWFHKRGVRTVIITSMSFPSDAVVEPKQIQVMASMVADPAHPYPTHYAHMSFAHVPLYFVGTGDLTAALLLAWLVRGKEEESKSAAPDAPATPPAAFSFSSLVSSLERTMATLQAVIARTFAVRGDELLLIQSKLDIEQPQIKQKAVIVDAADLASAASK